MFGRASYTLMMSHFVWVRDFEKEASLWFWWKFKIFNKFRIVKMSVKMLYLHWVEGTPHFSHFPGVNGPRLLNYFPIHSLLKTTKWIKPKWTMGIMMLYCMYHTSSGSHPHIRQDPHLRWWLHSLYVAWPSTNLTAALLPLSSASVQHLHSVQADLLVGLIVEIIMLMNIHWKSDSTSIGMTMSAYCCSYYHCSRSVTDTNTYTLAHTRVTPRYHTYNLLNSYGPHTLAQRQTWVPTTCKKKIY